MPSSKPSDAMLRLIVESYQRFTGLPLISHVDLNPLQLPLVRGRAESAPPLIRGGWEGFKASGETNFNEDELREALWEAPRAIVAHGTEVDPIFFYANDYALRCFEMTFDEFSRLPSRLSAEPVQQDAREQVLRKVMACGYIDGYSGIRIASSGKRFTIADCTLWNLTDARGDYHGQAAVFVALP